MVDKTHHTDGSELTYQEKNHLRILHWPWELHCVPHLIYQNGRLDVLNIQPGHPTNLTCPYRISKPGEHMLILEWEKCMDSRKEVLGSNIVWKAKIGDMKISILHNGDSGPILFFAILP